MNYDYPDASYQKRRAIIEEHRNYQMGLLYFVANDPKVPSDIREKLSQWGLAKDEFKDNEIGPIKFMFVRRRMMGRYITTEQDVLLKEKSKTHRNGILCDGLS